MKPDATGRQSALVVHERLSRPWTRELIKVHIEERGGDASTYNNGIAAFEKYLRSARDPRGLSLRLSMLSGNANVQKVVELYRDEILAKREDNPPLMGVSPGGFIAQAPYGDIAVVPRNALDRADVRSSALVAIDERDLPNDDIPRFVWPTSLIPNADLRPKAWKRQDNNLIALVESMLVYFSLKSGEFDVRRGNDSLGSFSPIEHFAERIRDIRNIGAVHEAWNAHLESFIDVSLRTGAILEEMLSHEDRISRRAPGEDPVVSDPGAFANAVWDVLAFAKAAEQAFMLQKLFDGTWERTLIRSQIAKMNNAMGTLLYITSGFDDLFHSEVSNAISGAMDCIDPIGQLERVYVIERKIQEWVEVEFENPPPKAFEGQSSPALRMLLDKIIYHAVTAGSDERNRLSFEVNGNRITAIDKSEGRALAPFAEAGEKRKSLEKLVARMGPGTTIGFSEESSGGKKTLRAIHILAPSKGTKGGFGRGTGTGGSDSPSSVGGICGLAPASHTMLYGATLSMAGTAAPMAL